MLVGVPDVPHLQLVYVSDFVDSSVQGKLELNGR